MAEIIIARSAQEYTRVQRGRQLFAERGDEFRHDHGIWWIPSCSGSSVYGVRLGPVEVCECRGFGYRGSRCKHIVAASVAQAKSRACSCCGQRVLGRFTTEVTEDDGLLAWFPCDVLCGDCIASGYWA
jgi:SWIM zinc finger